MFVHFFRVAMISAVLVGTAPAKPVASTPLPEAIEKASVICAARLVGHEYDDLKAGQTAERGGVDGLMMRYRVTDVLRDPAGRVKVGQALAVRDRTNACVIETEVVRYDGGELVFREKTPRDPARTGEMRVRVPLGRKVILLLDAELGHYGWFASPQDDTAALRVQLKAAGPAR